MKEQLEKIRQEAMEALDAVSDSNELESLRVRFLGKKGELTAVLKTMGTLSAEERPVFGQAANSVREAIEEKLEQARQELKSKALDAKLRAEAIDITIPGTPVELGHRHPMNKALDEAKDIFISMGFKILDGPEVELADYNFTKLNIAENHPSRDRSDTFYVTDDEKVLLRTQTSPMVSFLPLSASSLFKAIPHNSKRGIAPSDFSSAVSKSAANPLWIHEHFLAQRFIHQLLNYLLSSISQI